jgi:hypothetical protein
MPRVAATVPAFRGFLEAVDIENLPRPAGGLELSYDPIPLLVKVRPDVMRDLSGGVTESDALIERRRPNPRRPVIFECIPAPEPDMMSLARAIADWLLERQILFSAEQVKVADWRGVIGLAEHGVHGDAEAALQGDGIRREPSRGGHGADEVWFRPHEGDIERVAGVSVSRVGNTGRIGEPGMMPEIPLPKPGSHQVCRHGPDRQYQEQPVSANRLFVRISAGERG